MESLFKYISACLELKPRQKEELHVKNVPREGAHSVESLLSIHEDKCDPQKLWKEPGMVVCASSSSPGRQTADPCCSLATQSIPLGNVRQGRDHLKILALRWPRMADVSWFEASLAYLEQWFSTFVILRPFNIVPQVVVSPKHTIIFVASC